MPLTEGQRRFAAGNHSLIYSFLNERGWDEREYYDIAAFGYLSAVRRYLTQPTLRRYTFSTIAWRSMQRSVAAFHRAEARRTQAEQRYLELTPKREPMAELEASLQTIPAIIHSFNPLQTFRAQGKNDTF